MNAAINDFLYHMKAVGRTKSSVYCYQGYLNKLAEMLGVVALPEITTTNLDQVMVKLRVSSVHSEITLNKIRSIYRSFFLWAYTCGKTNVNPAAALTLSRATSLPTTPITASELETLFNTIRASGAAHAERDELLFAIYAFTGIRRTEALALKRSDYDASTSCKRPGAHGVRHYIQADSLEIRRAVERAFNETNSGQPQYE